MKRVSSLFLLFFVLGSVMLISASQETPQKALQEQQEGRVLEETLVPKEQADTPLLADTVAEQDKEQALLAALLTKEQQEQLAKLPKNPLQAIEDVAKHLEATKTVD